MFLFLLTYFFCYFDKRTIRNMWAWNWQLGVKSASHCFSSLFFFRLLFTWYTIFPALITIWLSDTKKFIVVNTVFFFYFAAIRKKILITLRFYKSPCHVYWMHACEWVFFLFSVKLDKRKTTLIWAVFLPHICEDRNIKSDEVIIVAAMKLQNVFRPSRYGGFIL